MSMNLKCNKIELYQTPTYITYMCTEPFDDDMSDVDFAVAALKQYLIWFNYACSHTLDAPGHALEVRNLINNPPKNLEVWIA